MLRGLFGRKGPPDGKPPSLEEQLETLRSCGFRLLAEATPEALQEDWSREQFEQDPYRLVLCALGGDLPTRGENVWHFDTECIEDHNDYAQLAERFRLISGGHLPLTDIEDYVDVEQGEAWIAFKLDGRAYRWTCSVEDDWVDTNIISQFAELLHARSTGCRFVYLDLGGQDCIIACLSPAELERARSATKLNFEWLT